MLLEIHTHTTRYSACSVIDPVSLVQQVIQKGLQGIIITEHQHLWSDEEILNLRRETEVSDQFLILPAQEAEVSDFGHVLVFGASESITETVTLQVLRKRFPDAALVWAHPFRVGKVPDRKQLLDSLLDGIEIFNLNHTVEENYLGLKLWHQYKFTALSGSDAHSAEMTGAYPTQFDHPVGTIQDVAKEIKGGRCRPFFKEIPKSGTSIVVTEITIGTKGDAENRSRIVIKNATDNKKWQQEKRAAVINQSIYECGFQGQDFRVPRVIDINDKECLIIEEGQRGRSLFNVLLQVHQSAGQKYFRLTAEWLAHLHNLKLSLTALSDTRKKEENRFKSYERSFVKSKNPFTTQAQKLIAWVVEREHALLNQSPNQCVQNHGDFHPKNIIIGQDKMHDISTLYVSVIDFGSSLMLPPAFDLGYFMAQFKNQFRNNPAILDAYPESLFVETYQQARSQQLEDKELKSQITLFKVRANLSIAAYLIKVGKGESPDMHAIITESLAYTRQR